MNKEKKTVSLFASLIPIVFLIGFLFANVKIFKENTLEGSNQIILIFAAAIAGLIGLLYGISWERILSSITDSIVKALPAVLILFLIGSLAGTWLISGVVPSMIYYGLKLINPKVFLLSAIVVSAIVSLATGSSWSTIATVGVALLGIGKALGFHEGLVAGAIISGAYFGDKMSPLSDTTNLAPAIAGTDLFTHIRYMMITTVPSISIAIVIFTVIGFTLPPSESQSNITIVLDAMKSTFFISPIMLVVPILLIAIIIAKVPAIPALLVGTILGVFFALVFQPDIIKALADNGLNDNNLYFVDAYKVCMQSMFGEVNINSDNKFVSSLLSTGGMSGMLNTVWLILAAMVFGGTMQATGMLLRITQQIIKYANTTGSLITSTIATSIFFNITASDQYISIVVPGEMFSECYRSRGYKPEVLSRTLEDGGTITSVLIPWNTCGATQSKVLGVSVWTFLPYCFFNLINPIVAIIIAYAGYKIRRTVKNVASSEK